MLVPLFFNKVSLITFSYLELSIAIKRGNLLVTSFTLLHYAPSNTDTK